MESDSRRRGKRSLKYNLHANGEKSNCFSDFFIFFSVLGERIKDALRPRFAGGGFAASVASLALGIRFILPRDAIQLTARRARLKLFR